MATINHPNVYCVEHTNMFAGVKLPKGLSLFDCRRGDDVLFAKTTTERGERILWGAEGVCHVMGVAEHTTPVAMQVYYDLRKASEEELANVARELVKMYKECKKSYDKARPRSEGDTGNGGAVYFRPIAVDIGNYGYGVIADRNDSVVDFF